MGTFKLPIHIEDVDSVTECWIYNRLAIIKTSPYHKDWIASHYNLCASRAYNFHFGDVCPYPPAYHDNILIRKQIRLFALTPENIIEKLKDYLINGYYIIMLIKLDKEYDYFHEVLFYGFDDEKQIFMTVGRQNRAFQTVMIGYSYIEETLSDVQKRLNNGKGGMDLALNFQYPATAMKLNPDFNPDNCVFEAYLKLKRELNGESYQAYSLSDFADYKTASHLYRGISCLDAYKQMIEQEEKGEKFLRDFRGIVDASKKLLEHRHMLSCSMEYILENWADSLTEYAHISTAEYRKCNLIVEKWLNLCLKYEQTQDKNLLKRIAKEVPEVFLKEKKCLEDFVLNGIDWDKFNEKYI